MTVLLIAVDIFFSLTVLRTVPPPDKISQFPNGKNLSQWQPTSITFTSFGLCLAPTNKMNTRTRLN